MPPLTTAMKYTDSWCYSARMAAFLNLCSVHPRIQCRHHLYGRIQSSSTLELWDFIFPKIALVKFMQLLRVRIVFLVPVYHLFLPLTFRAPLLCPLSLRKMWMVFLPSIMQPRMGTLRCERLRCFNLLHVPVSQTGIQPVNNLRFFICRAIMKDSSSYTSFTGDCFW